MATSANISEVNIPTDGMLAPSKSSTGATHALPRRDSWAEIQKIALSTSPIISPLPMSSSAQEVKTIAIPSGTTAIRGSWDSIDPSDLHENSDRSTVINFTAPKSTAISSHRVTVSVTKAKSPRRAVPAPSSTGSRPGGPLRVSSVHSKKQLSTLGVSTAVPDRIRRRLSHPNPVSKAEMSYLSSGAAGHVAVLHSPRAIAEKLFGSATSPRELTRRDSWRELLPLRSRGSSRFHSAECTSSGGSSARSSAPVTPRDSQLHPRDVISQLHQWQLHQQQQRASGPGRTAYVTPTPETIMAGTISLTQQMAARVAGAKRLLPRRGFASADSTLLGQQDAGEEVISTTINVIADDSVLHDINVTNDAPLPPSESVADEQPGAQPTVAEAPVVTKISPPRIAVPHRDLPADAVQIHDDLDCSTETAIHIPTAADDENSDDDDWASRSRVPPESPRITPKEIKAIHLARISPSAQTTAPSRPPGLPPSPRVAATTPPSSRPPSQPESGETTPRGKLAWGGDERTGAAATTVPRLTPPASPKVMPKEAMPSLSHTDSPAQRAAMAAATPSPPAIPRIPFSPSRHQSQEQAATESSSSPKSLVGSASVRSLPSRKSLDDDAIKASLAKLAAGVLFAERRVRALTVYVVAESDDDSEEDSLRVSVQIPQLPDRTLPIISPVRAATPPQVSPALQALNQAQQPQQSQQSQLTQHQTSQYEPASTHSPDLSDPTDSGTTTAERRGSYITEPSDSPESGRRGSDLDLLLSARSDLSGDSEPQSPKSMQHQVRTLQARVRLLVAENEQLRAALLHRDGSHRNSTTELLAPFGVMSRRPSELSLASSLSMVSDISALSELDRSPRTLSRVSSDLRLNLTQSRLSESSERLDRLLPPPSPQKQKYGRRPSLVSTKSEISIASDISDSESVTISTPNLSFSHDRSAAFASASPTIPTVLSDLSVAQMRSPHLVQVRDAATNTPVELFDETRAHWQQSRHHSGSEAGSEVSDVDTDWICTPTLTTQGSEIFDVVITSPETRRRKRERGLVAAGQLLPEHLLSQEENATTTVISGDVLTNSTVESS